jgi:peptidoglycan/LPS O-acetylase OafA/YrhL
MSSTTPQERYHSLDALRAFALLLGIVYHAAESFEPDHMMWAIVDCSSSIFLHVFRFASHSFRLEIFFLIAGFFAHLVYHRRGSTEFILNRIKRILIPLIVGWFFLSPMLAYVWILGALKSGNAGLLVLSEEALQLPAWKITLFSVVSGEILNDFDLTHLWFLHQLFVIYAIVLIARGVVTILDRQGTGRRRLDGVFRWVMQSRWNVILLTFPTVFILLTMNSWDVDTPKESLYPHIPTTLLYGFIFLIGWFLHRQVELLKVFQRAWPFHLIMALLLLYPSLESGLLLSKLGLTLPNAQVRIVFSIIYAWMMWSWVFGVTGFFMRFCTSFSPAWRYVADASYFLYILHIPVVVWLQVKLAYVDLHWTIKFPFITLITFFILFLAYHYLARSTFIGATLNGRKYPFQPLFFKKFILERSQR